VAIPTNSACHIRPCFSTFARRSAIPYQGHTRATLRSTCLTCFDKATQIRRPAAALARPAPANSAWRPRLPLVTMNQKILGICPVSPGPLKFEAWRGTPCGRRAFPSTAAARQVSPCRRLEPIPTVLSAGRALSNWRFSAGQGKPTAGSRQIAGQQAWSWALRITSVSWGSPFDQQSQRARARSRPKIWPLAAAPLDDAVEHASKANCRKWVPP